jgi:mRNA interferase MazF
VEVRRGMIVIAAGAGDAPERPRPYLVVQSDLFNEAHASVTLCPMTSMLGGEALFRVAVAPTSETGLTVESEVQVDKIQFIERERIARVIGRVPATALEQVDQALRRWLEL